MFERALVQECPYCFKYFCRTCAIRSGYLAFCSKACAEGWFFADDGEAAERRRVEGGARIRAFLAVSVHDPGLETALGALRGRLPKGDLRWVSPTQRHLTLRFFEELPEDRVENVRGAAGAAAAEAPCFDLELEGLGYFPARGPAKVVWAGCGGGREALVHLAAALSRELASRGFPTDMRPFSPHLTLARSRNPRGSAGAASAVHTLAALAGPLGRARVEALLLIRSTLGSGPPRHDILGTFPLAV